MELERVGMKGALESGDKLAAEDTAEHFDGKKEGAGHADCSQGLVFNAWEGSKPQCGQRGE